MPVNQMKLYRKFQYAELKGVSRQRISRLVKENKLLTRTELGEECIIDCPENDAFFAKPAHNKGKQIGGKKKTE